MGSNNVIVIDSSGARGGMQPTIEVGEGPTGLVLDESQNRLYVLNKFEASISYIDTASEIEIGRTAFFDPSPPAIKTGRKHLYDTRKNSGLGQVSCASCHVDGRLDRLAWDLGNPAGEVKPFDQNCTNGVAGGCQDWHPMKGPMTTQTLQDIIGKEPHHWRGDRNGLEEFSGAFMSLLGDDETLTSDEMQEFEDFLASITFGPNAFRNFDNTLPMNLSLPGHFTPGRFAPAGQPLPDGDALNGLSLYRTAGLDGVDCVACHTLPTGIGSNYSLDGFQFTPLSPGPNGELHHAIVAVDGSTNISMKIPQLRNLYDKVGFEQTQLTNTAGFGFLHDGSVDSLAHFVSEPVFSVSSDQEIADLVAFMLSFSGSDLPTGSPTDPTELPGPPSNDTHAAVGTQTTLVDESTAESAQLALIADMIALADASAVGLVVKGVQAGIMRGYYYVGGNQFQSDRQVELLAADTLRSSATPGGELTYLLVPLGSEVRIGVDRDEDGFFDGDEIDGCSDPTDPQSVPPQCEPIDLVAPIPAPPPHDIRKIRYISIDPRGEDGTNAGREFDIRVTITSTLVNGVTAVGAQWWANLPDANCISIVGPTRPPTAPNWDACPTLHLTGCPIIPTSSYDIVVVDGGIESDPLVGAATQLPPADNKWWGDAVGIFTGDAGTPPNIWTPPQGVTNFDDVNASLKTFIDPGAVNATHTSVTDIHPNRPDLGGNSVHPNRLVSIDDVFQFIQAFQGAEYPGAAIHLCPDP